MRNTPTNATNDVIAMYLGGQKILYTEAKTYCEQHLNYLMLSAIFITAACSILSVVLQESTVGPILVSGLTPNLRRKWRHTERYNDAPVTRVTG